MFEPEKEDKETKIRQEERAIFIGRISRLKKKTLIDIVKEATIRDNMIDRNRVQYLFQADCGHVLKDLSEIGGICQFRNCGAIVCKACVFRCFRCGRMLCPRHTRIVGGIILCPTCAQFALGSRFISRSLRGGYAR